MQSPALTLINAIQSCQVEQVAHAIAAVQAHAYLRWSMLPKDADRGLMPNPVNEAMPAMAGVTPLHVAARAYAAHVQDAKLAPVFDAMVGLLLEAGANPWLALGAERRDPGLTVVQVCHGSLPPSLKRWLATKIDDRTFADLEEFGATRSDEFERKGRRVMVKKGHDQVRPHSTTKARLAHEAAKRREALTPKQRGAVLKLVEDSRRRRRFSTLYH